MKYDSFSIRIESAPGDSNFTLSVRSPRGEGRGVFQIPPVGELPGAGAGPGVNGSRDLVSQGAVLKAPASSVGKALFRELFRDEVAHLFHASLGSLQAEHHGLRIRISIDPRRPELAVLQRLPWELLCRPETEDFLCLSRRTPVVRFLEAHRERRPAIARPSRLRILAVSASPGDCTPLAVARERKNLEEAWRGQKKNVEIVFLERGGLEEIRRALLKKCFHVLHFMGHGSFNEEKSEGELIFEGSDGTGERFDGQRLAYMLHDFQSLRLIVLNACHTAKAVGAQGPNPFAGVASSLVMAGVPAVVAMSGPVSDPAAVAFSRTFYQRLAAGDSIEAAVTEGRLAIQRADPLDGAWATPALFLRSSDGKLFVPRSTIWARRAALLAGFAVALALLGLLWTGWSREHKAAKVMRLANDGIGLLELGRKEEARRAFQSALKIDPGNATALGNLAIVEMQLGDNGSALGHAQAAVSAAPREAVYHYNFGNLLALQKRYEEALDSLRRAVEIDPGYANAYNELGNIYLELDHLAEARKAFVSGLIRAPMLAKLHKNLARVALVERHADEAVRHLEKALSLYPPADAAGRAEATYWLAVAHSAAGRAGETCTALRKLGALDPGQLSPFAKDARLLARRNRCNHVYD